MKFEIGDIVSIKEYRKHQYSSDIQDLTFEVIEIDYDAADEDILVSSIYDSELSEYLYSCDLVLLKR